MNIYESIKENLKESDTNWDNIFKEVSSCNSAGDLEYLMSNNMNDSDFSRYIDIVREIGRNYTVSQAKKQLKDLAKSEMNKTQEDREDEISRGYDSSIKNRYEELLEKFSTSNIKCDIKEVDDWAHINNIEGLPNTEFTFRLNDSSTFMRNTKIGNSSHVGHPSIPELISYIQKKIDENKIQKSPNGIHTNPEICEALIDGFTSLGIESRITGISNNTITITSRGKSCHLQVYSKVPGRESGMFGLSISGATDLYKDCIDKLLKYSQGKFDKGDLFRFQDMDKLCNTFK